MGCGVGRSVRARMLSLLRLLGGVGVMLLLLNDARRPRVLKVSWRRTLLRMMWMMLYSLESVKGPSSIQCQIECDGGERRVGPWMLQSLALEIRKDKHPRGDGDDGCEWGTGLGTTVELDKGREERKVKKRKDSSGIGVTRS